MVFSVFFVNIKGTSGDGDASFKPLCVKIGLAVSAVACLMESNK